MMVTRAQHLIIAVILILSLGLYACSTENYSEVNNMSQDIQTLSKVIHLPGQPEKVWWQTATIGKQGGLGPDDWCLIAVMKFKKDDLKAILRQSKTISGDVTLHQSHVYAWFPDELENILIPLPDGTYKIQSAGFDPAPFVRSPLLHGYMLKIDDATLFLFLGTS